MQYFCQSMLTPEKIKDILKTLPNVPGVYQFYDKNNKLIYVGKAKNLKNRVSSYFNKNKYENGKTKILVSKIVDIKTIKVPTEMDALLLENSLIKKYQPKYNIQLKDDKTYPWIKILNEPFPRVIYTRQLEKDGGEYFGPFHSVVMIKTLLDLFKQSFDIRHCTHKLTDENIGSSQFATSVEYYIGNCKGCCQGEVSKDEYSKRLRNVRKVLKGNSSSVVEQLRIRMKKLATKYEFEKAQEIKEKLTLVEGYQAKSTVVSSSIHNVDVFSIDSDIESGYINFLKVMNGAIIQSHTMEIKKVLDETKEEMLEHAILEIREKFPSKAKEILLSIKVDLDIEDVKFVVPQRGEKVKVVELSRRNAEYYKQEKYKQLKNKNPEKHAERILTTMQKDLRLKVLPRHIECFDNSNIQGTNPVAACVVFKDTKPSKKDYRHFNIKTVEGPDDFASMEEVVYRRYKRLLEEGGEMPQLIIIDGGKGQLSSAVKALNTLELTGKVAVIGIAKKLEEIYYPGDSLPIYIDKRSETLKIIQFARNEAHRFGITHHRGKRRKSNLQKSVFSNMKGVGPKTQSKLMMHFKSVKRLENASIDEVQKVIGKSLGNKVYSYLHP